MSTEERFVPKVHPLDRPAEAEDPLELVAAPVGGGDPGVMLECIVQEFAWMGFDAGRLMGLFRSPEYPVLNQLLRHYGEAHVRALVEALLARWGVFTVSEAIDDEPEPDDGHDGPTLIQLEIRRK